MQPSMIMGNAYLQYREGTLKLDGRFRASLSPIDVFANVQTARAGEISCFHSPKIEKIN